MSDVDSARLIAGLIAAGVILFVAAGIATPTDLYQEPDFAARLQLIDVHRARFLLAQALWALWLVVPTVGLVLLSTRLRSEPDWLPMVAAGAIAVAAVAGVGFIVLQTVDPERSWLTGEATWMSTLAAWLLVGGAAVLGLAMIQTAGWTLPGALLAAFAAFGAGGLVLGAPAFIVSAGFFLVALAPATRLWQQGPA